MLSWLISYFSSIHCFLTSFFLQADDVTSIVRVFLSHHPIAWAVTASMWIYGNYASIWIATKEIKIRRKLFEFSRFWRWKRKIENSPRMKWFSARDFSFIIFSFCNPMIFHVCNDRDIVEQVDILLLHEQVVIFYSFGGRKIEDERFLCILLFKN